MSLTPSDPMDQFTIVDQQTQDNLSYDDWMPSDPEDNLEFPIIPSVDEARVVGKAPDLAAAGSEGLPGSTVPHFVISSGAVLWGHLPRIFEGSRTDTFDGPENVSFRSAARNGKWMVRKAFSNTNMSEDAEDAEPTNHFGYVICHESVDPDEVIETCASSIGTRSGKV